MSGPKFYAYPGHGAETQKTVGMSQSVRINNIIEISGQGGWNRATEAISPDLETEIAQAFENVDVAIRDAGGQGWSQIYNIRTYHVAPLDDRTLEIMVANLRRWSPGRQPCWTCIGVAGLALEGMRVEIEAKAYVD